MASSAVLLDSSFLFALNNVDDTYHRRATEYTGRDNRRQIIPDVVLTEVAYLLKTNVGQSAVLEFLDELITPGISFQALSPTDIIRAREIMSVFLDSHLDFVDCCIMALSERLEVTRVCTFDRRDFAIFRPKHCDFLELLP